MSRFADPTATRTVSLKCDCPGKPHEQDEVVLRYDLGSSALARIGRAELEGSVRLDPMAAYRQTVYEAVESWTFLWPGQQNAEGDRPAVPVPITLGAIAELDVDTLKFIAETADKLIESEGVLPNASGAPSPDSSRGSASPTRTRRPKPTT